MKEIIDVYGDSIIYIIGALAGFVFLSIVFNDFIRMLNTIFTSLLG